MAVNLRSDKFVSMPDAVNFIKDGDKLVVGGVLIAREPNALVRQIIKAGKRNLHVIAGAHSLAIDMLCAGGVVGTCENSFVGYEFDLGLALNYRRACEQGKVKIRETDCNILLQQWRAAQYGVPFLPMPRLGGSDILGLHPEFVDSQCPVTNEPVTLVPAIKPDVAIIHAHLADDRGNVKIFGPVFKDRLMAIIAETTIISVERIVSEKEMKELSPTIPYFHSTAIVEAPLGAHPGSCYPDYAYDRKHLKEFVGASKHEEDVEKYLEKYVFQPASGEEYLKAVGGTEKIAFLKSWDQGMAQWMEVFK